MAKFDYKVTDEPNFMNVFIEGPINETFSTFNLKISREKSIRFDFTKVTTVNSMGIRFWIAWIHNNPGVVFHFRNCPVCVVDQINNVSDFMPSGTSIESFFVPYYGEVTGEEKHELYVERVDFKRGQIPTVKLVEDSYGNRMEIDVYPQKYFKFLLR